MKLPSKTLCCYDKSWNISSITETQCRTYRINNVDILLSTFFAKLVTESFSTISINSFRKIYSCLYIRSCMHEFSLFDYHNLIPCNSFFQTNPKQKWLPIVEKDILSVTFVKKWSHIGTIWPFISRTFMVMKRSFFALKKIVVQFLKMTVNMEITWRKNINGNLNVRFVAKFSKELKTNGLTKKLTKRMKIKNRKSTSILKFWLVMPKRQLLFMTIWFGIHWSKLRLNFANNLDLLNLQTILDWKTYLLRMLIRSLQWLLEGWNDLPDLVEKVQCLTKRNL